MAISIQVSEPSALADLARFFERIGYPVRETSNVRLEVEARQEGVEESQVRAEIHLYLQTWMATRPRVRAEITG
jgi:hypothetical protein